MGESKTSKSLLFLAALVLGISCETSARLNARPIYLERTGSESGAEQLVSINEIFQGRRQDRKRDEMKYSSISSDTSKIACDAANDNCDCPDSMYCRLENDSCNRNAQGFCDVLSARCTREYRPVCGCDGVTTYPNTCVARWGQATKGIQAGIKYRGKCKENV